MQESQNFLPVNTTGSEIQAMRKQLQLSQTKFAVILGVSIRTLQGWEQVRRKPTGSARSLLLIAVKHPKISKKLRKSRNLPIC